jgi:hypothetical protein
VVSIIEMQRFFSPKDIKLSIRVRLGVEKEQEHDSGEQNKQETVDCK